MKFKNISCYLLYFISILLIGSVVLIIDLIILDLAPKSLDPGNTYLNWCIFMLICYLLPSICLTIVFLRFMNSGRNFSLPGLLYLEPLKIKLSLNKEIFKHVIEFSTIVSTFFLLIAKIYLFTLSNTPFDSLLFIIYPVNLGFKLWEYTLPKTPTKTYFPHRKYK